MSTRKKQPQKTERFNVGDPVWYWKYGETDEPIPTVISDAFDYGEDVRIYRLELSDKIMIANLTGPIYDTYLFARPADLAVLDHDMRLCFWGLEGRVERFVKANTPKDQDAPAPANAEDAD